MSTDKITALDLVRLAPRALPRAAVVIAALALVVWGVVAVVGWVQPADETCGELAHSVRHGGSQEVRGLAGHEWLADCAHLGGSAP